MTYVKKARKGDDRLSHADFCGLLEVQERVFRDPGLASALSNVPSRAALGEEVLPLLLEPPRPTPVEVFEAPEGATPSAVLGSMASAADQEWWQRLHEQLETMHRDVQES